MKVVLLADVKGVGKKGELINAAEVIVISGGGLEEAFMSDTLSGKNVIDGAAGIELTVRGEEADNHIWMSPVLAKQMAKNICNGLAKQYPEQKDIFESNLQMLNRQLRSMQPVSWPPVPVKRVWLAVRSWIWTGRPEP